MAMLATFRKVQHKVLLVLVFHVDQKVTFFDFAVTSRRHTSFAVWTVIKVMRDE